MLTDLKTQIAYSPKELKDKVALEINDLLQRNSFNPKKLNIIRLEFPCEPIDQLTWLHNQNAETKIYWSNRDNLFEMAGIGVADIIEGDGDINHKKIFEYVTHRLSLQNPYLRYYGGFSFHNFLIELPSANRNSKTLVDVDNHSESFRVEKEKLNKDEDWQKFHAFRFIVPQFELFRIHDKTTFAFNIAAKNITPENIEKILLDLDKIDFSSTTNYRSVPIVKARHDYPDKANWHKIFSQLLDKTGQFKLKKIVLARKSTFSFDKPIKPDALLKHLKNRTPECYHFCFQINHYTGFLGATPEMLYKQTERNIETEALAGTIARGENPTRDKQLEEELLASPKNILEHQYVVEAIQGALNKLCTHIDQDGHFKLRKLTEGQHIVTHFKGTLHASIRSDQILSLLHPTPAVGGYPQSAAIKTIQKIEPFKRGWYAGPVGYIGYDTNEFAVAIRSGLVNDNKLSVFAGAGIVEGSTCENEWNEIESKITNFIDVFNQ